MRDGALLDMRVAFEMLEDLTLHTSSNRLITGNFLNNICKNQKRDNTPRLSKSRADLRDHPELIDWPKVVLKGLPRPDNAEDDIERQKSYENSLSRNIVWF